MRGKLENGQVTGVETLFQGGVSAALGSRLAFAPDGKLFMTTGGAFAQVAQDLSTIYGKVLRLNADGSVPADNPFVGREGAEPAIYSYGHRDQHGLMVDAQSGAVLNAEHGNERRRRGQPDPSGRELRLADLTFSRQYDGAQAQRNRPPRASAAR
jgi:glucose/arabinose dehydrogenase